MAVHNFSKNRVRITVRLPRDAGSAGGRAKWRHVFGGVGAAPAPPQGGRLTVELPPYGYHWFGRREGV
jgi:hypothetical protein